MKYTGTISRGVKAPIIRKGDNIIEIVNDSLLNLVNHENVELNNGDIICITESVVAISQNNFATINDIAEDVKDLFAGETVGIVFPIMSRNRFVPLLKGIRKGVKNIVLQLSYPGDEVGNKIISENQLYDAKVNPYSDSFTKEEFRSLFPNTSHEYTGIDYINLYQEIMGDDCKIILANDPREILKYTSNIIVANVHHRKETKEKLIKSGADKIVCLDDILKQPRNNSGYNPVYGLLGANLADESSVKLFPRDADKVVLEIQNKLKATFNKTLEVMIYGDGAFKDPKGGIWELCDPVVSPGYTKGLRGTPSELKLKYLANSINNEKEMKKLIKEKEDNLVGKEESLGTTPRQIVDLLGSLADLTSGSGDKGTPFVLIQNYFSNYASE